MKLILRSHLVALSIPGKVSKALRSALRDWNFHFNRAAKAWVATRSEARVEFAKLVASGGYPA